MHIETLKIFCDLIETQSFSKAASLNFLTQSAVSQQIKQIEEHFGKQLVERGVRTLRPTEAGEIFYQGCKEVLQHYYELESRMMTRLDTVGGVVRVSMIYSVGLHEFPPYLKRYIRLYPQVNVRVEYARMSKVYDDVMGNLVDIGLVAYPVKRSGIAVIPFAEDKLVCVCHPKHELTRKKQLKLADLKNFPFVGFERDAPTRRAVDKVFRARRIPLHVVMEFDNVETIKGVVEIDGGISIIPLATVQREVRANSLKVLEFADYDFKRPLGIVFRKGKTFNLAARKFVELLTEGKASLPAQEPGRRSRAVPAPVDADGDPLPHGTDMIEEP